MYTILSGVVFNACTTGNRGGVEFGFLSTSASKEQAIGYINFKKGMCQLYEMNVGQVDRGADLSWISYFPDEKEVYDLRSYFQLSSRDCVISDGTSLCLVLDLTRLNCRSFCLRCVVLRLRAMQDMRTLK